MISKFTTPKKEYYLQTEKYICNKFGLAEFLTNNFDAVEIKSSARVLDVGCGAGPLGIYFAEQLNCFVKGVELNSIAYQCCKININQYSLEDKFFVFYDDFSKYISKNKDDIFDLIVANPPIDCNVPESLIEKYKNYNFEVLNDEAFSYLTNSWHSIDGYDLLDYIFIYAQETLSINGKILLVICLLDCETIDYVIERGQHYSFTLASLKQGYILPESIGAESITTEPISTYLIEFVRR